MVSVDVSEHLVGWANLLHHQRGVTTVSCHHADGTDGYPPDAPYGRIVAWCAPPRSLDNVIYALAVTAAGWINWKASGDYSK